MSRNPTIDDAIRLLTDPQNRASPGRRDGQLVEMGSQVLIRLQQLGADELEARRLIREAAKQRRGRAALKQVRLEGNRTGRAAQRYREVFEMWIPESELRKPD